MEQIKRVAERIYASSEELNLSNIGSSEASLRLRIVPGLSFISLRHGGNYNFMIPIHELNRVPTRYLDPSNTESPFLDFCRFPQTQLSSIPINYRDVYSVWKSLKAGPIYCGAGMLPSSHFNVVSAMSSGAMCVFGDFSLQQYFLQHRTIGRDDNNLAFGQFSSVTHDMLEILKYSRSNVTFVLKFSGLMLRSAVEYVYVLKRHFKSVRLCKPIESNWLTDTFILVCAKPLKTISALTGFRQPGSIQSLLAEGIEDKEFNNVISGYISRTYTTMYWTLCLLQAALENKVIAAGVAHFGCEKRSLIVNHCRFICEDEGQIISNFNQLHNQRAYDSSLRHVSGILTGGQVKLYLSELRFFSAIATRLKEDNWFVVYAGAAPGLHIPSLIRATECFNLSWLLYDPRPVIKINDSRVQVYQQLFTIDEAKKLNSEKANIILISDIRTSSSNEPTSSELLEDYNLQNDLLIALKPKAALLKMRFPFYEETLQPIKCSFPEYLPNGATSSPAVMIFPKGDLLLQAFQPSESAEMRLQILSPDFEFVGIGLDALKIIEERMFYFNRHIRFSPRCEYERELARLEHKCLCNDCGLMYVILRDFHIATDQQKKFPVFFRKFLLEVQGFKNCV